MKEWEYETITAKTNLQRAHDALSACVFEKEEDRCEIKKSIFIVNVLLEKMFAKIDLIERE
jgi:hypothetical protein